jgi:hypothetical protein
MKDRLPHFTIAVMLIFFALVLAACGAKETPTPLVIKETVEVEVPVLVTPEPGAVALIPFEEEWASSGHADLEAEAFTHWDEDDPAVVEAACAKCHSEGGYLDFLGVDGTEAGVVDNDAPIGTSVTCVTCHNDATLVMDSVVMPSGLEITGLGDEARCMQCHQGRESAISVNASIEGLGLEDDQISEELGFVNIHYYAAAATKYGTLAKGGYEYEGNSYDARFDHVEGYDTCIGCHNSHTLEVKVSECSTCHIGVASQEDLVNIRMVGSLVDYDGDGDTEEGITSEIAGLQEMLYQAIRAYASEVAGTAVAYDSHAYPYFFIDTNEDGEAGEDEANYGNSFNAWSPRLLKAAYNYQVSYKDPGAYAHGGKYIIQLLYDSIADLNTVLSSPVDLSTANRIDDGHFAGSEEPFRHWDEDEPPVVEAECSRCHSATGLPLYIAEGVSISQPISNGFSCSTCHDDLVNYTRYEVASVTFPSGTVVDSGDANTNLCMNCHQGLASTADVNEFLAEAHPVDEEGVADETVIAGLDQVSDLATRDASPHYFAAGATLFGTEAQGGYQYEGKTYLGRFTHVQGFDSCTSCHSAHGLDVKVQACSGCHPTATDVEALGTIRSPNSTADYDGDGDTTEGLAGEIDTLREALYAAIQAYAADNDAIDAIIYTGDYPYWFIDTDANGAVDPGEAIYPNQYATWTPRLFKAAYNYSWSSKDPGAFAHNGKYILQLLYDSIEDLGGSISGFTRP